MQKFAEDAERGTERLRYKSIRRVMPAAPYVSKQSPKCRRYMHAECPTEKYSGCARCGINDKMSFEISLQRDRERRNTLPPAHLFTGAAEAMPMVPKDSEKNR